MKRLFLFLATNLAVVLVLSVTLRLLGVDRFLTATGLDVGALMIFSLVDGFGGSFISLLMSKPLAAPFATPRSWPCRPACCKP